jgi:hypothetical protein
MYPLPTIEPLHNKSFSNKKRILILAEGFENRSLSFISHTSNIKYERIIICKYRPQKPSRYNELILQIRKICNLESIFELDYDRFAPYLFEINLAKYFDQLDNYDEIVADISVMSKYMIMQILCSLRQFSGNIRLIYTEPEQYAPLQEHVSAEKQSIATLLPSVGVQNIVKTPLLSSIIMQRSPSLLVAFLSFNEQLIRALLTECNPSRLLLINGTPPKLLWRERAMNDIHKSIINEYHNDNPVDSDGLLKRKCSTLHYEETFKILSEIYKQYCETYRIVLSPTGSKMQAIACALIKNCCEDIHIEYPTPESYFVGGYSSAEIKEIHQLNFHNYEKLITTIAEHYSLNG